MLEDSRDLSGPSRRRGDPVRPGLWALVPIIVVLGAVAAVDQVNRDESLATALVTAILALLVIVNMLTVPDSERLHTDLSAIAADVSAIRTAVVTPPPPLPHAPCACPVRQSRVPAAAVAAVAFVAGVLLTRCPRRERSL